MEKANYLKNSLLIIDGYGFIFRAYHVLPALTSATGEPIGAIYGFTSMLLKVLNDFNPTHAVVAFDAGGKNFRHKIYEQYKGHRPPMPQDLIDQLGQMRLVAKALNFSVLEKEGVEADDIIATLKSKADAINENVIIISSDKDLMQLINGTTTMFDAMKNKYITREDVIQKFGVGPEHVREVLALMGDKSDNIPGVPSIGTKTASDLINQFGSVDNLLNSIDQVKSPRLREVLTTSRDIAKISWELVGLDYNIDELNYDFDSFIWTPPSEEQISEFLGKYNFKSLHKRIENLFKCKISDQEIQAPEGITQSSIHIEDVTTTDKLKAILKNAENKGIISVYLVQNKKQPIAIILGIDQNAYVIRISAESFDANLNLFDHQNQNWFLQSLTDCFNNKAIKKITNNLKELLNFFSKTSLSIQHFHAFEDLELMEYSISAGLSQADLSELTKKETDHLKIIDTYCAIVINFPKKYDELINKIRENHSLSLYKDIDLPLGYVLHKMEYYGVMVDIEVLQRLSEEFTLEIDKLEKEIYKIACFEFNIASPKQLGEALFEKMQLPAGKLSSKTKSYSTNAEVLEKLSQEGHIIADALLRWRQLTKLKNTYTDALIGYAHPKTNRIHTTLLQNSTTTGRLSSQDPNLQNIPIRSKEGNKIRGAFIADRGCKLISADYSQIELRILSQIANVDALKEAFINKEDIHNKTACNIFKISPDQLTPEHRRKAKAINFGIIYGISAFGLAKQLNIGARLAAEYIAKYFEEYPGIKKYMENTKSFAKEHGYVENLFGRKCFIESINNKNGAIRQFAERAAINAPIQGTNADIIKIAMINLDNKIEALGLQTKMILQIHDELLFEAPEEEVDIVLPIIKSTMENCPLLNIPLVIETKIGDNWRYNDVK